MTMQISVGLREGMIPRYPDVACVWDSGDVNFATRCPGRITDRVQDELVAFVKTRATVVWSTMERDPSLRSVTIIVTAHILGGDAPQILRFPFLPGMTDAAKQR